MFQDDFLMMEDKRKSLNITQEILERRAGLSNGYYSRLLYGRRQGSAEVMRRLQMALNRLAAGQYGGMDALLQKDQAIIKLAIALICEAQGLEAAAVQGQRPEMRATGSALWLRAARVRGEAWSLVNGVFGLRGVEIAKAAGVSKAAVSVALRKVEERREDGAYDAQMTRLERAILGTEW